MNNRCLLIGLGSLGAHVVTSAGSRLSVLAGSETPAVTSIAFDLETAPDHPEPTLSLPLDELKEVLLNLDYRSDDPSGWRHWLQWFPDPERCVALLDGVDSAGRSRPVGRLAFEINRRRIENELRRKTDGLRPRNKHQNVEIMVVASLMDGLGSGMLFDVLYCCRSLLFGESISLYLALPENDLSSAASLRPYQNTYAGLTELRLFASRPQCFTPTWQPSSAFRTRHSLASLDQVYLHTLPLEHSDRRARRLEELTRCIELRCHDLLARVRRQLLATVADTHFLCQYREPRKLSGPKVRRASCSRVELSEFPEFQVLKTEIQARWTLAATPAPVDPPGDGDDESRSAPLSGETLPSLLADLRRRISDFVQSSGALPPLVDELNRRRKLLDDHEPGDNGGPSLDRVDDFLSRVGRLFFSPNLLTPADRQDLLTSDLAGDRAERRLEKLTESFLERARSLTDEEELRGHLKRELSRETRNSQHWLQGRPRFEHLQKLWKEAVSFNEYVSGLRIKKVPRELVGHLQDWNRLVTLEILRQASAELPAYQVTRNFLRVETYQRLTEILPGLSWNIGPDDSDRDRDTGYYSVSQESDSSTRRDLTEKLSGLVELWQRAEGERKVPRDFLQKLRAHYERESRLLLYLSPEPFQTALESAFQQLKDDSPFQTRVPPAVESQPIRSLVIVNLPQALFWGGDDDDLHQSVRDVAATTFGDALLEIRRVPKINHLWLFHEEVGRPLHHLKGIVDFRDAYEHPSSDAERSTFHIDRALVDHLPDWPETEGVQVPECPPETSLQSATPEPPPPETAPASDGG